MSVGERIKRYRTTGGAADLTRVEVLVPRETRGQILTLAEKLRGQHRRRKAFRAVNAEAVNDRAKLIIHRLLARRMAADVSLIGRARQALCRTRETGRPYEHLAEWEKLLGRGPEEIRRFITARTDEMYRLRASSPLAMVADMEDPDLRRRIWRKARQGLAIGGA